MKKLDCESDKNELAECEEMRPKRFIGVSKVAITENIPKKINTIDVTWAIIMSMVTMKIITV